MSVIVLAYHRVFPGNHIDPDTFAWQVRTLAKRFAPLTLAEVAAYARGELALQRGGFAVTFDDGWADNFFYAYPILKQCGVPAAVFLPTGLVSGEPGVREGAFAPIDDDEAAGRTALGERTGQYLRWDEVNAMKDVVAPESHARSHAYHFRSPRAAGVWPAEPQGRLRWLLLSGERPIPGSPLYESGSALASPRWFPGEGRFETEAEYRERVREELTSSAEEIFARTGRRPKHLAWPFGEYSDTAVEVAKEAGFEGCYTIMRPGLVRQGNDPFELRRFAPPRRRGMFLLGISGRAGMALYRAALKLL